MNDNSSQTTTFDQPSLESLLEINKRQSAEIAELKANLTEVVDEVMISENELAEKDKIIESLNAQLAELTKKNKELEQELEISRTSNLNSPSRVDLVLDLNQEKVSDQGIDDLKNDTLKSSITSIVNKDNERLKSQLNESIESACHAQLQSEELRKQLEIKQQMCDQMKSIIETNEENIKIMQKKCNELAEQLQEERKRANDLQQELQQIEQKCKEEIQSLQQKHQNELNSLREQLDQQYQQYHELELSKAKANESENLKEKEKMIEKLQSELEKLQTQHLEVIAENEKIKTELKILSSQEGKIESESLKSSQISNIQETQQSGEEIKPLTKSYQELIDDLKKENQELREKIINYETRLASLREKSVKFLLPTDQTMSPRSEREFQRMQKLLFELNERNEELMKKYTEAKDRVELLTSQMNQMMSLKQQQPSSDVSTSMEIINQRKEIDRLRDKLALTEAQLMSSKEAAVKMLRQLQKQQVSGDSQDKDRKIMELREKVVKLEREKEALVNELKIKTKPDYEQKRDYELKTLQSKYNATLQELQKLQEGNKLYSQQIQQLQKAAAAVPELMSKNEKLMEDNKKLVAETQKFIAKKRKLAEIQKENADLKQQLSELAEKAKTRETKTNRLVDTLSAKAIEHQRLERQVKEIGNDVLRHKAENKKLQVEIRNLKKQLKDAVKENCKLLDTVQLLDAVRQKYEQALKAMESGLENVTIRIENLEEMSARRAQGYD